MKYMILILIRFYQKTLFPILHYLSPNGGCRFFPTCSEYGYEAVKKHGAIRGLFKILKRIIRCNPLNKGGYDPV